MTLKEKLALLKTEFTNLKTKITTKLTHKEQVITEKNTKLQESNRKVEEITKENSENEKVLTQLLKEFKELGESIPEQIVANRLKHVRNFLKVKEDGTTERVGNIETQVSPNLSYNIFGRTFSASEMVVLL
ncbi:14250_t:CDS:2 [Funneliformis geosporum]|uniref:9819_t:CDS:1 n=1 Tax=Funneliformis geosporum TaxID=1117311 RepID=A0A9W4WWL1_9GLOM|nr:14250_t:CDS:2 [Funneliformis geosporum]CAI2191116.1 9819_t:CDS:2 [Funneliformis geosporum]